jgi:protocatechuate 3,4-dioxygenase beta subunit
MRPRFLLWLAVAAAASPAAAREPVIGRCDGCEAVFEGLPGTLSSEARIAPAGEPGTPLRVEGRVFGSDGAPRAGVVVYAYQTDAEGVYPPAPDAAGTAARRHGALRGWVESDTQGRYAFDTIRPASYPGREIPAHIHMHVIERGCATYYIDDIVFTDDPLLTPARRPQYGHGRGGPGVATPQPRGDGAVVVRDIRLGAGVPGYPECA